MERAKELLSAKEVAETFKIAEKFVGVTIRCTECNGTGKICNNCGWAEINCSCRESETDVSKFDPVVCDECSGTGELA